MKEVKNTYNILVGQIEGKGPLGSPKHNCEDNIRMDHRELCKEV
jgi:hypothetical protein